MKAVNLLPRDGRHRPAGEAAGKSAYIVCGLLALVLAMVAAYVLTANNVTERKSEAAAAGAEADRLEAEIAAQADYTSFADIAEQRLSSVAGVAQTRFDWERLMREVSHVMPEGSWLQATDASVTGDPNATATAPLGTVATPTGPYASFVGCTPDQSDVAQIMVRLRNLHRVEDVKLRESTKEAGAGAATVDNCGALYKFDVAVTFAPTGPRQRGPARLGPGARVTGRWIVTLTDRDRKVLIFLVPVLVIAAYWFLLLSPQREEASKAAEEVVTQEERRDTAQASSMPPRDAKQDFSADYTQIVRLGKAIPASVDMPSLIVQLDTAAAGTGITFTKIKTGERVDSAAAATPRRPAPPRRAPRRPPIRPRPAAAGGEQAQSAPGRCRRSGQQHRSDRQRAGRGRPTPRPRPPGERPARGRRMRRPGHRHGTGRARRAGDRAARARVHRQLLQPGRLLPRRQTLRGRGRRATWWSAAAC